MKIKVCGLGNADQVKILDLLDSIHYLGFIFYDKSKRYIGKLSPDVVNKEKIGVFVNESIETIELICLQNGIQTIQLHGDESPEFCAHFSNNYSVIKAIGIKDHQSFEQIEKYEPYIDFFLFDTQTSDYGGSGKRFDWSILESYKLNTPFILSGGINPSSAELIKELNHPKLIGIDINSGFENSPGDKNIKSIEAFIKNLQNGN